MSWYGGSFETLSLSGEFHHNRTRIISSQVGAINPYLGPLWSVGRPRRDRARVPRHLRLRPRRLHHPPHSARRGRARLPPARPGVARRHPGAHRLPDLIRLTLAGAAHEVFRLHRMAVRREPAIFPTASAPRSGAGLDGVEFWRWTTRTSTRSKPRSTRPACRSPASSPSRWCR